MKIPHTYRRKRFLLIGVVLGLLALPAFALIGFSAFDGPADNYGPGNCAVTVQYIDPVQPGERASKLGETICYKTRADYEKAHSTD
ncbi:MAG: hypothetical protein WD208_07350 [Dehalococcoidia bacterium]